MRLVTVQGNAVEVNYMFLPTFLGLNAVMLQQLEQEIGPMVVGKEPTDDVLDAAHEAVLDFFARQFGAIEGLRDYLDAVKFISEKTT